MLQAQPQIYNRTNADLVVENFKNILEQDDTFTKPEKLETYIGGNANIPEPLRSSLLAKVFSRKEKSRQVKNFLCCNTKIKNIINYFSYLLS